MLRTLYLLFASQHFLGMRRRYPAPFLGDADGHDFIFFRINGFKNRSGREQRDFMLAAATAKQDTHSELLHLRNNVSQMSKNTSTQRNRVNRGVQSWPGNDNQDSVYSIHLCSGVTAEVP